MANEREEIQIKNSELEEEVLEYEKQLADEEMKLQELNDQAKAVSADVDAKE